VHRTPLYQFHLDHGAKMVDFAGWEMPIMYRSGVIAEHRQVRGSGGLFDVSHMGRLRFRGRHARRLLERVCTRRVSDMVEGQARYSLICNEQGGVKDDVLVYRMDDDDFHMVVNASNREKIVDHVTKAAAELNVEIKDQTFDTAMIAVQGPKVMDHIGQISSEIPTLKRYRFTIKNLLVMKLIVSRTGYTGEDGVEVILPAKMMNQALKLLTSKIDMDAPDAVIKPAGLAARDTLRMEAGMPLYSQELGEELNAMSCGLDFAINLDKDQDERGEPFIGQDALRKAREHGVEHKIVGLLLEGRRSARAHMPVRPAGGGDKIGEVTSACLSPTLGRPIAMALVNTAAAEPGAKIEVDTGKTAITGEVTKLPFYKAK
jgi:aminomethyltransferase